ncbi:hypothetical protein VTK26DRAFT_5845 [Humicola hyalothermophila]
MWSDTSQTQQDVGNCPIHLRTSQWQSTVALADIGTRSITGRLAKLCTSSTKSNLRVSLNKYNYVSLQVPAVAVSSSQCTFLQRTSANRDFTEILGFVLLVLSSEPLQVYQLGFRRNSPSQRPKNFRVEALFSGRSLSSCRSESKGSTWRDGRRSD